MTLTLGEAAHWTDNVPVDEETDGAEVAPAQWQLVSESLHAWGEEHAARPSDLGVRLTYLVTTPPDETRGPDCDFAVPFETP